MVLRLIVHDVTDALATPKMVSTSTLWVVGFTLGLAFRKVPAAEETCHRNGTWATA